MPLPGVITYGTAGGGSWPQHTSGVASNGPISVGGTLYTILPDATAHVARCFRSTDGGQTWTEQDASHAPACSATYALQGPPYVALYGTTLYGFQIVTTSSVNILQFNTTTNLWATAITGPTISIAAGGLIAGLVRSDGSLVLVYQGATETVMGSGYQRLKLHYRSAGGVWNGPYDVIGSANSPPANTLPGTQISYSLAQIVLGAGDRTMIFWATSTAGDSVHCRVFTSSSVFTSAVAISGTALPSGAAGNLGTPVAYTDGATTRVAIPVIENTTTNLDVARCDTSISDVATNWTVESTGVVGAALAALVADAKKLWLLYSDPTDQSLWYLNDAGAAVWAPPQLWKAGAQIQAAGLAMANLGAALGVEYYDNSGPAWVAQSSWDSELLIGYSDTGNQALVFQSFQVPTTGELKQIRLPLSKVGSPSTTPYAKILPDAGGSPDSFGNALPSSGFSMSAISVTTTKKWLTMNTTPTATGPTLQAGTTYWLCLYMDSTGTGSTPVVSTTNYLKIGAANADVYANQQAGKGATTGGVTLLPAQDVAFMLYLAVQGRAAYDRIDLYASKVATPVGSSSTIIDLGDPPPDSYTVYADVGDNADPAGTVEIAVEQSWDQGAWMPAGNCGPLPVQALDGVALAKPARFIKVTTTVTGSSSVVGTSGV